jgi:Amt family ammonium transporter
MTFSFAQEPLEVRPDNISDVAAAGLDAGDTAWMFTSSVLVLMMTIPGLLLFYGGLVRSKSAFGTIMHSFIVAALISVQWVLWGYSLAFGPDLGSIVGNLNWVGLNKVGPDPNTHYGSTISQYAFMIFQITFAIITLALITGALAERVKFGIFGVFILLWAKFIYDPLAHWQDLWVHWLPVYLPHWLLILTEVTVCFLEIRNSSGFSLSLWSQHGFSYLWAL